MGWGMEKQKPQFETNNKKCRFQADKGTRSITKWVTYNWNTALTVHNIIIHDDADYMSETTLNAKSCRKDNRVKPHRIWINWLHSGVYIKLRATGGNPMPHNYRYTRALNRVREKASVRRVHRRHHRAVHPMIFAQTCPNRKQSLKNSMDHQWAFPGLRRLWQIQWTYAPRHQGPDLPGDQTWRKHS